MSYPPPQQQTPPTRRGSPVVLLIGLAIMVVAALLLVIGGFRLFSFSSDLVDKPEQTTPQTVTLEEGETIAMWSTAEYVSCTVTGPAGEVPDRSFGDETVSWGGKELHRQRVFEAQQDGEHTISCSGPFVVGGTLPKSSMVMMSGGGVLCCPGVLVLVVGLVLWLRRRRA